MKTVCPHCNQEFPETPDEYLGMTLECPSCHQNFVCEKPRFCTNCETFSPANAMKCSQCGKFFEKPKFCSECGAANPAKALKCAQCGNFFEKPKFCPECGTSTPANAMKCAQCGNFFEKPKFCPECGTPNPANAMKCSQCGAVFSAALKNANEDTANHRVQDKMRPGITRSADGNHRFRDKLQSLPQPNQTGKSKAMTLANWGSGLGFAGLFLGPLFGIPGIVLGIMAFCARTEEEKSGWSGSSVNNRALTAIITGIFCWIMILVI